MSYIVTVSPKGQITIPSKERQRISSKKYLMEVKGKTLILRPIEIKILKEKDDEVEDFAALAESSFSFWNDEADDIYQKFYDKK